MSNATGSHGDTYPIFEQLADIITTKFESFGSATPVLSYHFGNTEEMVVQGYGAVSRRRARAFFSFQRGEDIIHNSAVTRQLEDLPETEAIDYSFSVVRQFWNEVRDSDNLENTPYFLGLDLAEVSCWIAGFGQQLDKSLDEVDKMLQKAVNSWDYDNNKYGAEFDRQGFENEVETTCEVLATLWGLPVAAASNVRGIGETNDLLITAGVPIPTLSKMTGIYPESLRDASTQLSQAFLALGCLAARSHINRAKIETSKLYRFADPRPHFVKHPSLVRPFLCFLTQHKDKEQDVTSAAVLDDSFIKYAIQQKKLRELGYSSFREACTDMMEVSFESDRNHFEDAEHDLEEEKDDVGEETTKTTTKKKKRRARKKKRVETEETASTSVPQLDAPSIAGTLEIPSGIPQLLSTEPGHEGEGSVPMAAAERKAKRWLDYENTPEEMQELVDKWTADGFLVQKEYGHHG